MVFGLGYGPSLVVGLLALPVLVYGADMVVGRLSSIAAAYNVPDVVVAMTVISIGTSLPELAAHTVASAGILAGTLDYQIASATVLGANIGSDVVQQTLVLGLVVFAFAWLRDGKYEFEEVFLKRDYFPMIGTTLMCIVLGWDGIYSRIDGLVLVGSFAGYMYYLYHTRGYHPQHSTTPSRHVRRDALLAGVGLLAVLVSAQLIFEVTEQIVTVTGLGGSLIGVVTLGVASALPEMFTAIEGIRHESAGLSLGTLIGSNITNPLLAIGGGAVISTYWVPRPLVLWDLPMETVTAALLLGYLLFVSDRKLGWKGGVYLVGLYVFYLTVRFLFFAVD